MSPTDSAFTDTLISRTVRERIVLVGVTFPHATLAATEAGLDELALLVGTAGADTSRATRSAGAMAGRLQSSAVAARSTLPRDSSGRSAFARDGGALIAAMEKGNFADFSSPAAKGKSVTDRFSLKGFGAAMKAVLTLCPDGG